MSFLDRLAACAAPDLASYRPFLVDGVEVGLIKPGFAETLKAFSDVFKVTSEAVFLVPSIRGFDARTRAVDTVLRALADEGIITGWRDEPYAVTPSWSQPAFFTMERAAASLFGIRAFGIHVNGFVRTQEGSKLWVAKRSKTKPVAPGKLDHIVAGGQPAGLSLIDNVVKEAEEEAGMPESLARKAVPVGAITYTMPLDDGLRRDVLFTYDLELPVEFVPRPTDGEAEIFYLWPFEKVLRTVRDTDDFKFNVPLVIIDFMIRHGILTPQDEPDYVEIVKGLRR